MSMVEGSVTVSRFGQYAKALFWIVVTLSGTTTEVISGLKEKTYSLMRSILSSSGMITSDLMPR